MEPDCEAERCAKRRRIKADNIRINHELSLEINEGSNSREDVASEVVCYGMLASLRGEGQTIDGRADPDQPTPVILGLDRSILSQSDCSQVGKIDPDDVELLDLLEREGIELELLCLPAQTSKRAKTKTFIMPLYVTLYGPRDFAADVGCVLGDLEYYLQDPTRAQRDALYYNPQKFCKGNSIRTIHLQDPRNTTKTDDIAVNEYLDLPDNLESVSSASTTTVTEGSRWLRTKLRRHQKQALTFMLHREHGWNVDEPGLDVWSRCASSGAEPQSIYINNVSKSTRSTRPPAFRGGILSDAMGLGKTLSVIALIAHDRQFRRHAGNSINESLPRGTLVVVPATLLGHWEGELNRHLHARAFSVFVHHGRHRLRSSSNIGVDSIVLTSYTLLTSESRKEPDSPILRHEWRRIVLDEAHEIHDLKTAKARAVCNIKAERRWAVTGTPIQNRLSDLFSLFSFLELYPYSNIRHFETDFITPWLAGDQRGLGALKQLLGFVILRRTATVIELPKRTDVRRLLSLSAEEQVAYDEAKATAIASIDQAIYSGGPRAEYQNALQKINALRAICELGCAARSSPLTVLSGGLSSDPYTPRSPGTSSVCLSQESSLEMESPASSPMSKGPQRDSPWGSGCDDCFPSIPVDGRTLFDNPSPSYSRFPSKIQALLRDLEECDKHTKSVVFSYRPTILDVAAQALQTVGISCTKIDGKVKSIDRARILRDFSESASSRVLLLSLRCGAVGLNLTTASRAYLLEPQWNPSIEEQALARIHRIGQRREVTTTRFLIENSIESYVLKIQDGKRGLTHLLTESQKSSNQDAVKKLLELRQLLL